MSIGSSVVIHLRVISAAYTPVFEFCFQYHVKRYVLDMVLEAESADLTLQGHAFTWERLIVPASVW